jgi:hypothetical protein
VDFEDATDTEQKATAHYNIDFLAASNSDASSFDAISYVSGIVRETLLKTTRKKFEAIGKSVSRLEYSPDKINNGTDNVLVARIYFTVETKEVLTDFDDLDGARSNMTNATINGGTYAILKEW